MKNPITALRALIASELAEVYTTLPGEVVTYDGVCVTARPALAKRLANGATLPAPQIVRVPVRWPAGDIGGARALISVPLKAGDPITLSFSARSLENWLAGDDGAPDDPRQFDLTDAFATPVVRPGTMVADPDNVSMQYGAASLKISPDGIITVVGKLALFNVPVRWTQGMTGSGTDGKGGAGTIVIEGNVDFRGGTVTHEGVNIGASHRHPETGSITGAPQ